MPPRVTFPLSDNYFRPVELSRQDEEQFQAWAMALVQETLTGLHRDQCMTQEQRDRRWKPLKSSGGLTAYRRRSGTEEDGDSYRYLCKGKIDGHLDEVMLGRYADNTDMFRRMNAVYREDLIDCMVLHTIAKQSPANPFFYSGFKWMTVKSPGKGLVKNRDVCWFEQSGLTRDHNGKEIGYHIAQSVDLPSCPAFDDSICVRARLSACYLFRRNKSGGIKVFMRGKNNAGGKVLDFVADMKSAELWLRAERAKLSAMAYISTEMVRAALPSDSPSILGSNNRCELCAEKTAGMMTSQKECAVCHRITCSRCVVKRRVLSSARDFLAEEKELFCKRCVRFFNDIKHRDPQSIAMVCAAAASRCEPLGPGSSASGYSMTYSHSSQASSSSSGSVRDNFHSYTSSDRGAHTPNSMLRPPPSPDMIYLSRQDSNRSMQSVHSIGGAPVMLYPESKPRRTKEKGGVRRTADSEASTVASSVTTSSRSMNPFQSSYSSAASDFSDDEYSTTSSFRDTTESSFHRRLHGSSRGAAAGGNMVRLGTTNELSPPEVQPARRGKKGVQYDTPEEMMAQMIRMNIMAEQARQMVQENDKFTRRFNFY